MKFSLALLLEGDDDQGDEDVHEEEWEDNKVDNVEDGHLDTVQLDRGLVFIRNGHGLLEDPGEDEIGHEDYHCVFENNKCHKCDSNYDSVAGMMMHVYSHWPAFCGLDGEKSEEGSGNVVVVELLAGPLSVLHRGRVPQIWREYKEFTPGGEGDVNADAETETEAEADLLAGFSVFHTLVIAEEEFSIKQLHSYHSKDEMEEDVDYEDVEDILEWVDDTVEDGFKLRNPLDGFERPEDPENSEWFYHSQIFGSRTSSEKRRNS